MAIDSILDMRQLFDGIDLSTVSVSMTMNGAVLPILALYVVAAEEQGVPPEKLTGDYPERHPQGVHGPQHLHLSAEAVDADHLRHLRLHQHRTEVQLDLDIGYHIQEAGATADLELAYTLADGVEYLKAGWTQAWTSTSSPRLSFFWGIGMNFFMEVAKLARAAAVERAVARFDQGTTSRCRCAHIRRPRGGR